MLSGFIAWWSARMTELLPWLVPETAPKAADAVLITVDPSGRLIAAVRRKGRLQPQSLEDAGRLARRLPALLRVPAAAVLEKQHSVPTLPRRDLDQMLRHELARITPFPAEALFWRWDGKPRPTDRSRTEVTLTMVPRMAVTPALETLSGMGIQPRFLEVGPDDRPRRLSVVDEAADRGGVRLARGLGWACAVLAVAALLLPFARQALALHQVDAAIEALQPQIAQVQTLRRTLTAGGAEQAMLGQEMAKTGDVLQVLATVTRILPDDTFLTDFALRNRHLSLGGRSASAPRLITGLSADPAIRSAAFAAPVTRTEGSPLDVFSIQGEVAPQQGDVPRRTGRSEGSP